jgi:hypothetical protein
MMLRLLWKYGTTLLLAALVVNGALLTLASVQPTHPALAHFRDGCIESVNPCWQGIVVGQTPLADVRAQLLGMGYEAGIVSDRFHYYYSDTLIPGCVRAGYLEGTDYVSYLRLYCIDDLNIGDVAASLGALRAVVYRASPFGDAEFLSFNADNGLAGILLVVGSGWDSFYRPVTSIDMYANEPFRRFNTIHSDWYGLLPLWRYCQLMPTYPRCR